MNLTKGKIKAQQSQPEIVKSRENKDLSEILKEHDLLI